MSDALPEADLKKHNWRRRYATSSIDQAGQGMDLLRAFYVPALLRSVKYDRVAGYFRSSALAAASRGFTALLQRQGKVRLIAGCDLAPHDIQAILDGHTERLEMHLAGEIDKLDDEPERIRRGVELLAHLVAKGLLDIRVAFRKDARTGQPITLDNSEDGYVHEKWGILTDNFGHRLSFSGSMNESSAALERNAENITTLTGWSGEADAQAIDEMAADFEALWEDRHPHFVVRPIPDAIRQKLLKIGERVVLPPEIDGAPAIEERRVRPTPMDWLRFAFIKHAPKMVGGETVGIYTAPITPWPHQEIVARRLVETYPYGYLLCDEVGLGKTIENGLAFRALWLSGRAKRILICPPASLLDQWQREMATKFLMPFGVARSNNKGARVSYLLPTEHDEDRPSLFDRDLLVVSTGLLQRDERLKQLAASEPFDIVLVDEAHFARRQNSRPGLDEEPSFGKLYLGLQNGLKQKSKALWLATATPMQLSAVEAYDLADLIGRLGCFASEHSLVAVYYDILGALAKGHTPSSAEQETLRIVARRAEFEDPALWHRVSEWLLQKDPQLQVVFTQWMEAGLWPSRREDERLLMRLLFAISPLHRVMLRHTRSLLDQYRKHNLLSANLAKRRIRPIPPELKFRPDEAAAYEELTKYCADLQLQIGQHMTGQLRSSLGFYLSLLQQRFASSAFAIHNTLRRRAERVAETIQILDRTGLDSTADLETLRETGSSEEWETDEAELEELIKATLRGRTRNDLAWERQRLDAMMPLYEALANQRPTKTDVLLGVMAERRRSGESGRYRQTVVFTRYADTLTHLVDTFKASAPDMRVGTFSGDGGAYWDVAKRQWRHLEKNRDQIKHLFLQGEIDLLLCTDAAAEGLNLQSADLLVNYDLPWNPMKVEQRIGRIDRIGQRFDQIEVLNLATVGSVEETIYGRLWDRLSRTAGVVGSQQYSILPITEDDFARLARGEIDHAQLEQEALRRLEEHSREIRQLEIPAEDLYHIFNKELRSYAAETRVITLDDIVHALSESEYLRATGSKVRETDGQPWVEIRGAASWGGLYTRFALTAKQDLYERGLADERLPLRFASYGEPGFDELVDEISSPEYQPRGVAVVRVSREFAGSAWEKVAIVAMAARPDGPSAPVTLRSYEEVRTISLDSDTPVPEEAVRQCHSALDTELNRELRAINTRQDMLKRHRAIGDANKAFMYLLAIGMLRSAKGRPDVNDPEKINKVIAEAREMAEEDRPIIYDMQLDVLSDEKRRDLVVHLGAELHAGQWRSTPHFRSAAMHIIMRELAITKKNHRGDATTTRLLAQLGRRVDAMLS
ncbi:MAG: DEAD/DEAH box helicase family protein [Phycisphaeraceae bacterium]|nr:DEAD/DEAH box helicase family protein [Phycisphaeraceae bacterium]